MAKLLKIKTGVDTTTDDIVVKKAKQLETARLINGVPFDGTQDIILEPGTSENADKVDGYHADTANVAETVVVRDTNKNINVTSVSADWFDLNTATEFLGIQQTPGRIFFDETHDTLAIVTNSGNKIEVGEDIFLPLAANKSGETIPNGYLVMATGSQGDKINVARAVTNGTVEPEFIVGVATVDILNDSENGRITTQGYVKGVNTSTWDVGTILYPDPLTPGWWTATRPLAPAIKTPYAMVIKSNAASGILLVRMSTATKLGQTDTNVELTNLQDNDLLVYNSLVGIWENKQLEELGVTGNASVTVAEAAPNEPTNGSLWFDSNTGKLNIYYIDVDSSQWISINDFDQLQIENWNSAYSWGNHQAVGYIVGLANATVTDGNIAAWNGTTGKLLKDTGVAISGLSNIGNWDTAYGWGNHANAGYLLSSTASSTYQLAGDYATLNESGKLSDGVIPSIAIIDTFVVASESAMLALTAERGDVAIRTDETKTYILSQEPASTLANWKEVLTPLNGVQSVSGTSPIVSTGGVNPTISINAATTSAAGSMSSADKSKLDGIAANANNYSHPTGFSNQPETALTDAAVISQITINTNGHVTGITSRNLTASNVGAATTADYSTTLPSTGWSGSGPYTIDVTTNLTTITETDKPIIDLDMASVAFGDIDAVNTEWGKVYRAVTYNGGITFYAKEAITQSLQLKVRVVK